MATEFATTVRQACLLLLGLGFTGGVILAEEPNATAKFIPDAQRGYEILRTNQYLPADFDDEIFADLWTVWPEPERAQAEQADAAARRKLTFSYYGIMPAPEEPAGMRPGLGYVRAGETGWAMNCLACHGGKVAEKIYAGLPNTHTAMQTLAEDVRLIKLKQRKPFSHLDTGSLTIPLNTTNGTSNSVIFGVVLGALRKPDMTVDLRRPIPKLVHHDMDAPPFWNVKKKSSLYCDGFSPKAHRPLMQFILVTQNGPEKLTAWEDDFRHILAWIESVEAPKYPFPIDADLAARGERVFNEHCATCHGTYGPNGRYEQRTISLKDVQTDPVRLTALSPEHRRWMKQGWLSRYGADTVEENPAGYVAPPLDGIWASAPYLHNGSVPTLWHLFHSQERPVVWKRTEDGYDQQRVGLEVMTYPAVPKSVNSLAERRRYFDTQLFGKSAAGHTFPDQLTEPEKLAVLEYLKSL